MSRKKIKKGDITKLLIQKANKEKRLNFDPEDKDIQALVKYVCMFGVEIGVEACAEKWLES